MACITYRNTSRTARLSLGWDGYYKRPHVSVRVDGKARTEWSLSFKTMAAAKQWLAERSFSRTYLDS